MLFQRHFRISYGKEEVTGLPLPRAREPLL
jgi:hypothetical protein